VDEAAARARLRRRGLRPPLHVPRTVSPGRRLPRPLQAPGACSGPLCLAADITALRARAAAINEQHSRYGVSLEPLRCPPLPLAHVPATAVVALRPAAASGDPSHHHQLVGLRSQADTLAEMVRKAVTTGNKEDAAGPPFSDTRLKVFSIVGFGGLGKTTLAMEVCRRLEGEFQRQALVSVSQAFDGAKDLKGLLKRVLQQIVNPAVGDDQGIKEEDNVGNIDTMDEDRLAAKLKETLKNKRYYNRTTISYYLILFVCFLQVITDDLINAITRDFRLIVGSSYLTTPSVPSYNLFNFC